MANTAKARPALAEPWNKLLHYGGYALMLMAIAYLVAAFAKIDFKEALDGVGPEGVAGILATGAIYVGLLALLAQAWSITAAGRRCVEWSVAVQVYGMGVVAKYVPGAVLQYASRHVLGARRGWSHAMMLRATFSEAALHIVCAAIAGASIVVLGGAYGGMLAIALGSVAAVAGRQPLLRAAGLQLCAFAGLALCVCWLAADVLSMSSAPLIVGAFMTAWILSFVVPIAPGGIGVRESAFLLLAGALAPLADLAVLAILTRAMTIIGDAGFGLLSYGLSLRSRLNRQASG